MIRRAIVSVSYFVLVVGCGHTNPGSLCDQIPAPPACMQACDPQPGAPNTCPSGYHCSPDGKCDAFCTPGGNQCGDGYTCTNDGSCVGNGSGSGMGPDADCPAVHFVPMKTTPSVELLLDRSGSMTTDFNGVTRFQAMVDGLFGATGAVTTTQSAVFFGEAMFAGDQTPCLNMAGFTAPRMLNNATAMQALTTGHPPNNGSTPTADGIGAVTADFAVNKPPPGSPPIILLATDGLPNSCGGGGGNGPSIAAAQAAYAAGVRLFIVGLAGVADQYLQDMANAGTGKPINQAPMCATCSPYYVANSPAALAMAFQSIINGVISCDLAISGMVDPASANQGTVVLNGMVLMYGTDWVIDPNGKVIHLLGAACDKLKNSTSPTVDASFPCGSVIF